MRGRFTFRVGSIAGLSLPFLLVCTPELNPFSDVSNARAVVRSSSFSDGDTVAVFGQDTFVVSLAVSPLVDSFRVSVPANRYFSDSLVIPWGGEADSEYRFFFSFYDTGWQEISVETFRGGGAERLSERYRVYVSSPLSQQSIGGRLFGEAVDLNTPGVISTDVRYHWDFGRGTVFHSPRAETTVVVWDAGFSDTGWLWVSDIAGVYSSPKASFLHSFDDLTGPAIMCVNEGYVGRDTIHTGLGTFMLRVMITDRGEERGVYEARVNGSVFSISQPPLYIHMLRDMDTVSGYQAVSVYAIDNGTYLNRSDKTFYVKYDSMLVSAEAGVGLEVLLPPRDSVVFSSRTRQFFGVLWNYTADSIDVSVGFRVNDSVYASASRIRNDSVRSEWRGTVYLDRQVNTVWISAVDSAGDTLADTSMTVIYDATLADEKAPVIVEVTANGRAADKQYTPDSTIHLRVVAYDEGSGLSGVSANGVPLQASTDGGGYVWGMLAGLVHRGEGNRFQVIARDRQGLADTVDVTVFRNHAPEVGTAPSPPFPLFVASSYQDRITVSDKDYDNIKIEKRSGPDSLTVDTYGNISWRPGLADTGGHVVEIRYTDQYEPQYYRYELYVKSTSDFTMPSFVTVEEDFPRYVEVGRDTVDVTLSVAAGYGRPPYRYAARAEPGVSAPVVTDSVVSWVPVLADTGYQRLYITVTDSFGSSDTLVPIILVVRPNQDFSFSVSWGGAVDTLSGGMLDFSASIVAETLTVSIDDPDHPFSEQHTVSVSSSILKVVSGSGSTGVFKLVVDPRSVSSDTDTVVVMVTDRAQHAHSDTLYLWRAAALRLTVNTSGLSGMTENVYDFPLLVRLSAANFTGWAGAASNGSDVRFYKFDGSLLAHEIERWDATNKVAEIWVKMDTVRANNTTQYFEMDWGKAGVTGGSSGPAVFETANGFEGVWHLGPDLADATGRGNKGTTAVNAPLDTAGVAGRCRFMDGTGQYVHLGDNIALLNSAAEATISGWVRTQSVNDGQIVISVNVGSGGSLGSTRAGIHLNDFSSSRQLRIVARSTDGGGGQQSAQADSAVSAGQWLYTVGVISYASDSIYVYVNGVLHTAAQTTFGGPATSASNSQRAIIGIDEDLSGGELYGAVDEVRVSRVRRSPSWIRLSYENQRVGSSLIAIE